MGIGFIMPPSASSRPLSMTGVMKLGRAIEARIATSTGPRWNHTSLREIRSVATAVKGTGSSSITAPSSSSLTWAITLPPRIRPGARREGSRRRRTLRWVSELTHSAYSSSRPAACSPPTSAPIDVPATPTISQPCSSRTWITPMWA